MSIWIQTLLRPTAPDRCEDPVMFLVPFHIESHRAHTPLRHSLALFASRSARAQADPGQTHPPFLVFLMLLTAWCLGEALPGEDA